jgi:hypothetical protein
MPSFAEVALDRASNCSPRSVWISARSRSTSFVRSGTNQASSFRLPLQYARRNSDPNSQCYVGYFTLYTELATAEEPSRIDPHKQPQIDSDISGTSCTLHIIICQSHPPQYSQSSFKNSYLPFVILKQRQGSIIIYQSSYLPFLILKKRQTSKNILGLKALAFSLRIVTVLLSGKLSLWITDIR